MALTRAIQVIFLQRPIGCIEQRVAMDFQLQNPIILRKSTLFPGCWSPVFVTVVRYERASLFTAERLNNDAKGLCARSCLKQWPFQLDI